MKREFAVLVQLESYNKGGLYLSPFKHDIERENGSLSGLMHCNDIKAKNIEVDIDIDPQDFVKLADSMKREAQLARIEEKERELDRLKAELEKEASA